MTKTDKEYISCVALWRVHRSITHPFRPLVRYSVATNSPLASDTEGMNFLPVETSDTHSDLQGVVT